MINADELTMEFRRVLQPHNKLLPGISKTTIVPPPTVEELAAAEPIARVVLTISAAKALKSYLDEVMPSVDHARMTGEPFKLG